MKTDEIKLLKLMIIIFLIPQILQAQQMPHQFSNGEVIDATKFNENFEFLVKKHGASTATVNCNSGASADPENAVYTSIGSALNNTITYKLTELYRKCQNRFCRNSSSSCDTGRLRD